MPLQLVTLPPEMQVDSQGNTEKNKKEDVFENFNIGLPRLLQKDALVLCGVDIPEKVCDGKLRVIVALKRVWHDAPNHIALIVRNTIPTGERRAAVVHRILGDDAEPVGLEVPLLESGIHIIKVQIAKNVDGELFEVFALDDRLVHVENPPAPNLGEFRGLCLRGVDCPEVVKDGILRCIVAIERVSMDSPQNLCLIARNVVPNGSSRCAVVRRSNEDLHFTMGIEVPIMEVGNHLIELIIAEEVEGSMVPIFCVPAASVTVPCPPMPRLMESESVVLCGVDVCGARWPLGQLAPRVKLSSNLKATVALARTWDDAPCDFVLVIRCTDESGATKCAKVDRRISGLIPTTVGLEVPFEACGCFSVVVVVAAEVCGELTEIFSLPKLSICVDPEIPCEVADVVDVGVVVQPIPIKISFVDGAASVIRRFTFPSAGAQDTSSKFVDLMASIRSVFRSELPASASCRLTYFDDDGDEVLVSSDAELSDAFRLHRLQQRRHSDASAASSSSVATINALRMTLTRVQ